MLKSFLTVFLIVLTQSIIFFNQALAQTAAPAPGSAEAANSTAPAWMQFVPFAVIIFVFYFFLIRPQAKKQQEQKNFLTTLKVGDQVITQSGILGKIAGSNDQIFNLEISNGVQIKILKNQVLALQNTLQTTK